jgi:Bifunctional DNA primase/polymerase, N-terminal
VNEPTALEAAQQLTARGWRVVPVPHRSKALHIPGWQALRLDPTDLPRHFDGRPQNVGLLTGEPSAGLADLDLDAAEAVRLAPYFLPETGLVSGRASRPRSHAWYIADPLASTTKFRDPMTADGDERSMLVELRSTGCQTIVYPSVHPCGETVRWESDGEPATVEGRELVACAARLATAALLARHWPTTGSRQDAALALAGGLLRGGWVADDVNAFIRAVAEASGDEESRKRASAAEYTGRRLDGDRAATGWPTLAGLVGDRVVDSARDWLGMRSAARTVSAVSGARAVSEPAWPDPIDERALHGLAGEIVRAIEPYSEADRAALLAHLLTGAGVLLGSRVLAIAGDAPHPARLNAAIVGETSKGRKGSAARPVERLLALADETYRGRITEGLSSGEGMIWQVRDPIYKYEKVGKGSDASTEEVLVDPGVADKRLWLIESELASTLRVIQREGNTLSALVRRAWDTGTLGSLTKNSPARATNAHIGITGHITRDELLRYLDRSELANGFANRFLWFASRRGRSLPDGEAVPVEIFEPLAGRLRIVQAWAATPRVLRRDERASKLWHRVYEPLSDGASGMFGAATNRAEAQVLRLSVYYALLDCSEAIQADHLLAALAVWRYAEQSARWIFGDVVGDPIADTILAALRQRPLARNEIYELFGRNVSRARIEQALAILARNGLATPVSERDTGGRPRQV